MSLKYLGLTDEIWVLDIESRSNVNLRERGQYIYWSDPSSSVLMTSMRRVHADPDEPTYLWDFEARGDIYPAWFSQKLNAPPEKVMFAAANCEFDRQGLAAQGYPSPIKKWLDVLVLAYILGFAGRLDDVLKQIFPDVRKDPEGTRLITLFSSPPHTPWNHDPDKWEKFRAYCVHDTDVETRLLEWCLQHLNQPWFHPAVHDIHRQELIYRRINQRGIPVDRAAVRGARSIRDAAVSMLLDEMREQTGLENPNSRNQLLGWLQAHGYRRHDLTKESVWSVLALEGLKKSDDLRPPEEIFQVLKLRAEIGKSSTKKFDALDRSSSDLDDRLRGGWQFYGASRTGRVAGRVLNPANLARPVTRHPEQVAEWMQLGNLELLAMLFPEKPIMDTLSSSIRASLQAPPGKQWCVADLTSIESVGVAWLAGCRKILDIFYHGQDTYTVFAAKVLGKPYEEVTRKERTFAKPCVLGGAYGLSPFGLTRYGAGMGVAIELPDAEVQIAAFREEYHEIPHYWQQLTAASIAAVKNPRRPYHARAVAGIDQEWVDGDRIRRIYRYAKWPTVTFQYDGTSFLYCKLPSGRFLCYYKPRIDPSFEITMPDGHSFTTESLLYWGIDQKATGPFWKEISTYGAKLLENITQAVCRDILWHGMEFAEEDQGLEVIGDVYDEQLTLCHEDDTNALDRLIRYMTSRPTWLTDDFFLKASGYVSKRYRKD